MNAEQAYPRALIILVPCNPLWLVVSTLLQRHASLGIPEIAFDIYTHRDSDPGCRIGSADSLRQFLPTHAHAMVIFDKQGCGADEVGAQELEDRVREQLRRAGWEERAEAIVIDPELEIWVWSDSPEVERCLGWADRQPPLRKWLERKGLWEPGAAKPSDPKAAMKLALHESHSGPQAVAFARLARSVSLKRCSDRAFIRFREILQRWFPAS